MTLVNFQMNLRQGEETILVDKKDVTKGCVGVEISAYPHEVPRVVLHFLADLEYVNLDGLGVAVIHDAEAVFRSLDADAIEEEAAGRLEWGESGTLTHRVLEVVLEKIREAGSAGSESDGGDHDGRRLPDLQG